MAPLLLPQPGGKAAVSSALCLAGRKETWQEALQAHSQEPEVRLSYLLTPDFSGRPLPTIVLPCSWRFRAIPCPRPSGSPPRRDSTARTGGFPLSGWPVRTGRPFDTHSHARTGTNAVLYSERHRHRRADTATFPRCGTRRQRSEAVAEPTLPRQGRNRAGDIRPVSGAWPTAYGLGLPLR